MKPRSCSTITVHKELELEFNLGNLLASPWNPPPHRPEVQGTHTGWDNTQLLINQLWQLPTEHVEEALVARLPEPATRLPGEKPEPPLRPTTHWQQFACLQSS